MKKKAVVLCLVGLQWALGTCTVSAANGTKNISATFRNIKIVVDGKEVSTSTEPFVYNGTTYLPIRAVGEAVGKEVTWNAGTNTVYLGEVPASAQQAQAGVQQQPETMPTVTSDLPVMAQYGEFYVSISMEEGASFKGRCTMETMEELSELLPTIRSGDESAFLLADLYLMFMENTLSDNKPQISRAAYAEAQTAFAGITNAPEYAEAKEYFEEIAQSMF